MKLNKQALIHFMGYVQTHIIHTQKLWGCVAAIAPGIILANILQQKIYFLASFFALASVIPYRVSHHYPWLCLAMLTFVMGFFYLFVLSSDNHWIYWALVLMISLVAGYLEAHIARLKTLVSWVFIGLLYGYLAFQHYAFQMNTEVFLSVYVVACIGIVLNILLLPGADTQPFPRLSFNAHYLLHYLKYFIYLAVGLLFLKLAAIAEPQWFLWSGLSVLSLNLETAKVKILDRLKAGLVGIACGLVAIQVLPSGYYLDVVAYVGIMLSLQAFKQYRHNFAVRCFFIVIFAGNAFFHISQVRMVDIIAGGVLGIVCSILLAYFDRYLAVRRKVE